MNLEPSPSASNSHDLTMNSNSQAVQDCLKVVHAALEDVKAKEVVELDVSGISNVADAMVIASGTSTRHIKSLANNVAEEARKAGFRPIGIEGVAHWTFFRRWSCSSRALVRIIIRHATASSIRAYRASQYQAPMNYSK